MRSLEQLDPAGPTTPRCKDHSIHIDKSQPDSCQSAHRQEYSKRGLQNTCHFPVLHTPTLGGQCTTCLFYPSLRRRPKTCGLYRLYSLSRHWRLPDPTPGTSLQMENRMRQSGPRLNLRLQNPHLHIAVIEEYRSRLFSYLKPPNKFCNCLVMLLLLFKDFQVD